MATPKAGKDSSKDAADKKSDYTRTSGVDVAKIRTMIARIVWTLFVLFALVLALAALLIALKANPDNSLVEFIKEAAAGVDLGVFDLDNPIKAFDGSNAETKTALFNYGLGAIAYLIVGRILDRLIRP